MNKEYYVNNQDLKGDELLIECEKRRLKILDLLDDVTILKNRVDKKNNEFNVLKQQNQRLVECLKNINGYIEKIKDLIWIEDETILYVYKDLKELVKEDL